MKLQERQGIDASAHAGRGGKARERRESKLATKKHDDIREATELVLGDLILASTFFEENPPRYIPSLLPEEIFTGEEVGHGEFGVVVEVDALDVRDREPSEGTAVTDVSLASDSQQSAITESARSEDSDGDINEGSIHTLGSFDVPPDLDILQSMAASTHRDGEARYAFKRIRSSSGRQLEDAVVDLACEAKFLASLKHPSIIRLRGTVGEPGSLEFAIVMDRLTMTLEDKIVNEWIPWKKACQGLFRKDRARQDELYAEQLLSAFDVARGMRFLHEKHVLYRDLKGDNIGFTVRGDVRILDFGLARELKAKDLVKPPNGYEATGVTGSLRYMAPEVKLCLPYGTPADVYSFSILLWRILALRTPFDGYDRVTHFRRVIEKGQRPSVKAARASPSVARLLRAGWNRNPDKRPTFEEVCSVLQAQVSKMENEPSSNELLINRTKHQLNGSIRSLLDQESDSLRL